MQNAIDIHAISEKIQQQAPLVDRVFSEMDRVIVGQRYMVERMLIGLICGGHILLEGVPGLAKTLTVSTLARILQASFKRIQFTPDLLPADLTGTLIYNPQDGAFIPKMGPVFANLVLADEINRAPAKVQSALLECMQERQVTIGDETYGLEDPFLVMATQNPIEQEGTYPLAEAQTDRFMLHVTVGYPTKAEEKTIMAQMSRGSSTETQPVIDLARLQQAKDTVRNVYLDEKVQDYIVNLVWATRFPGEANLKDLEGMIEMGASPRASIALNVASRAHAFLNRRAFVTPEDIKAIGPDVLRHRLKLTYEAEAENVAVEDVIRRVFENVAIP